MSLRSYLLLALLAAAGGTPAATTLDITLTGRSTSFDVYAP
jgi:hypothetical protein